MPVGYGSSSSTGANDTLVSTINVPVPSGVVAGNHVYVALEQWEATNPTVTPPAGFTLVGQQVSGSQKLKVFVKEATGSDTGNYTFSWTGSQWTLGHAVRVTGAKAGDPTGANFNGATSASGTAIPNTSVTVGFIPGLLQWSCNENGGTQTTPPTNFTEVQDSNYLHSNHNMTAAASGTFTAPNGVMSVSTLILAFLVAIEPAAGGGGSVAVGTAVETDASLPVGKAKRKTAGFPTQTSTAEPVARLKSKGVATVTSTEASLPLGKVASKAAGTTTETEQALPIGRVKSRTVGLASESDAALAIGAVSGGTSLGIAVALETDSALSIGWRKSKSVGTAAETSTAGVITLAAQLWRLVMPAIPERHVIKGSLAVTINREATVFGDENGLFTTEQGSASEGSDDYGAIPFGTKYIWYGGHVNTTDDPAVKNLWLAHGFEVENV